MKTNRISNVKHSPCSMIVKECHWFYTNLLFCLQYTTETEDNLKVRFGSCDRRKLATGLLGNWPEQRNLVKFLWMCYWTQGVHLLGCSIQEKFLPIWGFVDYFEHLIKWQLTCKHFWNYIMCFNYFLFYFK